MSVVIDAAALTLAQGFTVNGEDQRDYAGHSVSSAGDINGDGIDDILIGALRGGDAYSAGEAYVIYGRADGLRGDIDVSNLAAADGFTIKAAGASNNLGKSVSGGGDLNGDGIDDLVIGAPRASLDGNSSGMAYVIFGSTGTQRTVVDLGNLAGTDGFSIEGKTSNEYAGGSVSMAGDVNGDGIDDMILGARDGAGSAYVIFGKAGATRAPVDAGALANDGFAMIGGVSGDSTGFSVAGGGDVNGDGIDDIIVGMPGNDRGRCRFRRSLCHLRA